MSKSPAHSPLIAHQSHELDYQNRRVLWLSHNALKPPKQLVGIAKTDSLSANAALKHWQNHTATVWHGDYHQAKALLDAVKRRLRTPKPDGGSLLERFHKHRLQQRQRSQLLSQLCVLLEPHWQLDVPRAPDVAAACRQAFGFDNEQPVLLPLSALLGYIGAEQWHSRGVALDVLDGAAIHVPFGVFSPLRGEYLALLMQAPLPQPCQNAWDIGTGSGVIALCLARRSINHIIATDTNPAALATARANGERLGFAKQITVIDQDLFPKGCADLIVCNPPWLPAKASSAIETALYDENSAMLRGFLNGVGEHLTANGQAWLIMSDLAERIGLRGEHDLADWIEQAGLHLVARHDTHPTHRKSRDENDPLYAARADEVTSLYCLARK